MAVLVTESVPERVPRVEGAKVMLNVVVLPAARVRGSDRVLALNALPVILTLEIVTL